MHLKIRGADSPLLDQLQLIMSSFKVILAFLHFENEKKVIKTGEEFYVDLSSQMVERLEELLGKARVKIKRKTVCRSPGPPRKTAEVPDRRLCLSNSKKETKDRQIKRE